MGEDKYSRRAVEVRRRQSQAAGTLSQQFSSTSPTCNSLQRPNNSQFSSTSPTCNSLQRPNNSQFSSISPTTHKTNYATQRSALLQPGGRGGAMAKPTLSSDPSIPIGPGLQLVRLAGRGFGQMIVWPAHAVRVCVWEGGCRCDFHSERRDFASENESLG